MAKSVVYKLRIVGALVSLFLAAAARGDFALVDGDRQAKVAIAQGESDFVHLAVQDLLGDVEKITGRRLQVVDGSEQAGPLLVVETVSGQGGWESYRIFERSGNLHIQGSDARGTMFGVYRFIEDYLEVDPLYFWSGIEPSERASLKWDQIDVAQDSPDFKFRGWFINDEDLLTFWKEDRIRHASDYKLYGQTFGVEVVERIVEALVRSQYNLFVPASFTDILNPGDRAKIEACARRGVFLSQHHQEPLGVSPFIYQNYWKEKGRSLPYSYISNREDIEAAWRAYAKEWARFPNVVWQLGLRGVGDRAAWVSDSSVPEADSARGEMISGAIERQMQIIEAAVGTEEFYSTMTLWAEGSLLNSKGVLDIPSETIVVFADNSPGWTWQDDFYETERKPGQAYGVYYHHALIGSGPHLAHAVPPEKNYMQLREAYDRDSREYALLNVANVREFVLNIAATSEMLWNMPGFDADAWLAEWVGRRFDSHRDEIVDAYKEYFDAFAIHRELGVPYFLDGHILVHRREIIDEMRRKLFYRTFGRGSSEEEALRRGGVYIEDERARDPFWGSVVDIHPHWLDYPREERLREMAAQATRFDMTFMRAQGLRERLSDESSEFLYSNLAYPALLMRQLTSWLKHMELADEALDAGELATAKLHLDEAIWSLSRIEPYAGEYCSGRWEGWYDGDIILNIERNRIDTVALRMELESLLQP